MTEQNIPESPLDGQFRSIRIVYYFMFGSLFLYMYLSEFLLHPPMRELGIVYPAMIADCLLVLIAGIFLRKRIVDRAAGILRTNPGDLAALRRWKLGQLTSFAIAEVVVLTGFVVRVLGSGRPRALVIYAAGVVFMSLWSPQRPR